MKLLPWLIGFFYHYQNKWIRKVTKVDLKRAGRLPKVFGFTDDLTAINVGCEFSSVVLKKYFFERLNSREKIQETLLSLSLFLFRRNSFPEA